MDVNRKASLTLTTAVINTALLFGLFSVHYIERRDTMNLFAGRVQFEEDARSIRELTTKLNNERWEMLMRRLDAIEQKVDEESVR